MPKKLLVICLFLGVAVIYFAVNIFFNSKNLSLLHQKEDALRILANQVKNQHIDHHIKSLKFANDALNNIVLMAQENNLVFSSANSSMQETNKACLHILVKGNFPSFIHFMRAVLYGKYLYELEDLEINQASEGGLTARLQFKLLPFFFDGPAPAYLFRQWQDPFVDPQTEYKNTRLTPNLMAFSANQIQLLGFAQQNDQVSVLANFPGTSAFSIKVGDVLGKEKALIKKIDNQQIIMGIAGHDKKIYFHH